MGIKSLSEIEERSGGWINLHNATVDLIRSLGVGGYGLLFGLSGYTIYIAYHERRNPTKVRLRKMWTAVILLGFGLLMIGMFGASLRWNALRFDGPLIWRDIWAILQVTLLVIGLSKALAVEAHTREEDDAS